MIDYEEVVEAIWRYDIPRIDIDEDVTTLYADGKAFAQVIRRPDGSREDLYFEDYELQKDTLIKPNAKLRDVVELCMNGDISYVDVREWCMQDNSEEFISWVMACNTAEKQYLHMIYDLRLRPEQARCVLPLCLKTEIVVTANYREWRNIFKLRTPVAAHPQMRELMCPLLKELQSKIPVVFDDIYTYWPEDDQTGKESAEVRS